MPGESKSLAVYMRSYFSILVFFLLLIVVTPTVFLLVLLSAGTLTNWIVKVFAPILGRPTLAAAGIRFRIEGWEHIPDRPVVFTINHSSTLDLLVLLALGLPRIRFVAKYELQYNPLFFILGRMTGQVFIQRQKSEKAVQRLQQSYRRLQKKKLNVMLAPEGSRKHPGIIGPFKKGPFRMAMDLGYPIVPIYIDGARELSKGGALYTRPGTITAYVHPPVPTDDWSLDTLDEHITEMREKYLRWAGIDPADDPIRDIV